MVLEFNQCLNTEGTVSQGDAVPCTPLKVCESVLFDSTYYKSRLVVKELVYIWLQILMSVREMVITCALMCVSIMRMATLVSVHLTKHSLRTDSTAEVNKCETCSLYC